MVPMALIVFIVALSIVAYTYCLFPLALAVLARFCRRSRKRISAPCDATPESLPTVTMVVAAHNEASILAAKLANTCRIDYPVDRFELLIGSDGSCDETVPLLEQLSAQMAGEGCQVRIRYHAFPQRRGKISVLNDLVSEVSSDIIVMSEANT